ncbi:MAG: methyltransferase domain-containing protein [Flammeovirgaceae bacterium]|nr:MAG: methyltransferase domain-containing protein [Flammeovirgaceae bacterium]
MVTTLIKRHKEFIKLVYVRYRKPILAVYQTLHRFGKSRKCYVCGETFGRFTRYKGGSAFFPEWISMLQMVGSDVDNFGCPYCNSFDRERHLFMYFDNLNLWLQIKNCNVLHFAPEAHLSKRIEREGPAMYIKADLFPANESISKEDATDISFSDNTFDIVIANHVLEHIPDYEKALREIWRVLKPGGTAILQTPFSNVLKNNFEDAGINTPTLRSYFYAQHDHVRVFGKVQLFRSMKKAGFIFRIAHHNDLFRSEEAYYYGVNAFEDLLRLVKPEK